VLLLFGDFGHQRAANKPADRKLLLDSIRAWMDHYLQGRGSAPKPGVVATTQTCPHTAPSEGPFAAPTFGELARGEVRFAATGPQTVESTSGDPQVAAAIDPVTGGGDACATTSAGAAAGTAVYRLPAASGYTLLGAPTVIAKLTVSGDAAQLAARLWDVAPDGSSQTLVARGTYRPPGSGDAVFQLHANGWRFAPGHVPKLELLGQDAPYTRFSNGLFSVAVDALELRLPVRDAPGKQVKRALAPVIPPGQTAVPRKGSSHRGTRPCRARTRAGRRRNRPRCPAPATRRPRATPKAR
jgi:hypothetical protein